MYNESQPRQNLPSAYDVGASRSGSRGGAGLLSGNFRGGAGSGGEPPAGQPAPGVGGVRPEQDAQARGDESPEALDDAAPRQPSGRGRAGGEGGGASGLV